MARATSMDRMVDSLCPACGRVVTKLSGRPLITAHSIELWHERCLNESASTDDVTITKITSARTSESVDPNNSSVEITITEDATLKSTEDTALGGDTASSGDTTLRSGDTALTALTSGDTGHTALSGDMALTSGDTAQTSIGGTALTALTSGDTGLSGDTALTSGDTALTSIGDTAQTSIGDTAQTSGDTALTSSIARAQVRERLDRARDNTTTGTEQDSSAPARISGTRDTDEPRKRAITRARQKHLPRVLAAGSTAAVLATAVWLCNGQATAAAPTFEAQTPEKIVLQAIATAQEIAPTDPYVLHPIPKQHGTPLDEMYPSLTEWVHPVVNTDRKLPLLPTGEYGAERQGVMRHECGRGHCGDDISGPVGRPIVAVAEGVVIHIDRSRLGKDRRSGRYVRIEHTDGTVTAYMHLNSISAGLDKGDHVYAGQQIGTLGATAVYSAPPHLHFGLELPNVPGMHGDGKSTHYTDPAPFLVRATVLDTPERHPPPKPSM